MEYLQRQHAMQLSEYPYIVWEESTLSFALVIISISLTVSDKSRRWKERLLSVIYGVSPRDVSDEKLVRVWLMTDPNKTIAQRGINALSPSGLALLPTNEKQVNLSPEFSLSWKQNRVDSDVRQVLEPIPRVNH